MCLVKYELGFYIPEDDTLHSDRRENLRYSTSAMTLFQLVRFVSAVGLSAHLHGVTRAPSRVSISVADSPVNIRDAVDLLM
jgi:hypothetical protein